MRRKGLTIAALVVGLSLVAIMFSCGEGDGCSTEGGKPTVQVTLPLLPIDLPIFPTDVTLDGLEDWVEDELDKIGMGWLYDQADVSEFFEDVEDQLREASIEVLQPGVLSVALDDRITEALREHVEITRVGVNFGFDNRTDSWVSVPTEFKLYLGESQMAEAWDESVSIQFPQQNVQDGQFIVPPGESVDLTIDNVPHIVEALNTADSIGIGYKDLYRMADFNNGADLEQIVTEFGPCLVQGMIAHNTSACPDVQEMLGWFLSLQKFELVIEAQADFDVPELPGCEEFADDYGLDLLKDACP